jgi:hypothetical protein
VGRGVEDEIETIRRYLDSVTSAFAQEYKRHEESLQEIPDDLPDHEAESYAEIHAEMQTYYIDRFPAFALETIFVSTYAFLEDEMMTICRHIGNHLKIELGPEKLSDKGIEAAKTYLEKLCDIAVPNDRLWQQAKMYGQLRNIFSHARGRVKDDNKTVQHYVAANTGKLSIDKGRLRITKEFCLEVLDDAEKILKSLLRLAQDRIIAK